MKSIKTLQGLNLLDRFLFAEAAERSGSRKIRALHEKVEAIRNNEEIGVKYMNALEERLLNRQEAFEEGGASRFERGEALGEAKGRLAVARNMLEKGMDKADIAEITGAPAEEIETL